MKNYLIEALKEKTTEELIILLDIRCTSCVYLKWFSNHFGYSCKLGKNIFGSCMHIACKEIEFKTIKKAYRTKEVE